MSMTLQQLVTLYILQKNHHKDRSNTRSRQLFEAEYKKLMSGIEVIAKDVMAPALFEGQPNIPFVLFKLQAAPVGNPRPLIIHTHGGPHVYMDKNKLHAEIAYFLSQNYIIACPNYRGSTNYPDIGDENGWQEWEIWEEQSKKKHHIYGPQDVYAVAKYMQTMPYVEKTKLFLRGGSFGSYINAHLLADIKKGRFESIFSGVHLSGGEKYPIASTMPDNIPLLITHSEKDEVAPIEGAKIFMEKILLRKLSYELFGNTGAPIQTYIAQNGDHHLIDPNLELDDTKSASYQELVRYLELTTRFIDTLSRNETYEVTDSYDQFRSLIPPKEDNQNDRSEEILTRVHSYHYVYKRHGTPTQNPLKPISLLPNPTFNLESVYGPTMSLLKLKLGKQFSGDIKTDFIAFLRNHFTPIDWTNNHQRLTDAGLCILKNSELVDQVVQMIDTEEVFLKKNPTYTVMYHAAANNVLQLYCFINLWKAMLQEMPETELHIIKEMRLFEFMKDSVEDIDLFIKKIRLLNSSNLVLNNILGFSKRFIACNPSPISNPHSTASNSLWWYFDPQENERAPNKTVVTEMLKVLGIYSPQRMARYLHLFKKEAKRLASTPQALMQQIFVPYSTAEKTAYMCQIWGEEFKDNDLGLKSPTIIKVLTQFPELFEEKLRQNKEVFTNYGDCEDFGNTDKGFHYASTLQIRYIPRNDPDIITKSYFRFPNLHKAFVDELKQLISEDYADYLAYGNTVPEFIVPEADKVRRSLYSENGELRFFKQQDKINHEAIYLQQYELYSGLVQNSRKEIYGSILELNKESKTVLQERLNTENHKKLPDFVSPYSLCRYLKGYTYYDLFREAVLYLKDSITQTAFSVEDFTCMMLIIDSFNPSVRSKIPPTPSNEQYHKLCQLIPNEIGKYPLNPKLHQLMPSTKTEQEICLWKQELNAAIEGVLKTSHLPQNDDCTEKKAALN